MGESLEFHLRLEYLNPADVTFEAAGGVVTTKVVLPHSQWAKLGKPFAIKATVARSTAGDE